MTHSDPAKPTSAAPEANAVIDINAAEPGVIAATCAVTREQAETLVQNRPYKSWDIVQRLPGFSRETVDNLLHHGAHLGGAEAGE